jgi:hypothetical protein
MRRVYKDDKRDKNSGLVHQGINKQTSRARFLLGRLKGGRYSSRPQTLWRRYHCKVLCR